MSSHIDRIEVDETQPDAAEARMLFCSLVREIEPILKRHNWTVKRFVEIDRQRHNREPRLLGRNIYTLPKDHRTSKKIEVLLRRFPHGDFRSKSSLMKTMIHELTHIAVGPHNAQFYRTMDDLTAEWHWHQDQGHVQDSKSFPTSGNGFTLGGKRGQVSQYSQRELAAWAAERRRADAEDGFDEDELCPGLSDALKESLKDVAGPRRPSATEMETAQLAEAKRRSLIDLSCMPCCPDVGRFEKHVLADVLSTSLADNQKEEMARVIRKSQAEALNRLQYDEAIAASLETYYC